MAYHTLITHCKAFLGSLPHEPRVMEVGVDRGVTFVTLVHFLAKTRPTFDALGIDVRVQEQVSIMLQHADLRLGQVADLLETNSLSILPHLVAIGRQFDLILLDGDHNYHTVSQELPLLAQLLAQSGMLVVDDYASKWGKRDMWYAEREGYEDNVRATRPVETERHGVASAVDDWLERNPRWSMTRPNMSDAVVLTRAS